MEGYKRVLTRLCDLGVRVGKKWGGIQVPVSGFMTKEEEDNLNTMAKEKGLGGFER